MTFAEQFDPSKIPDLEPTSVPGMISEEEQKLYYELARSSSSAGRKTIEIGTWLGLSTLRICQGLASAGPGWHLMCFDRFEWTENYHRKTKGKYELNLLPGDSFEWKFRENLGEFSKNVSSFQGDVVDFAQRVDRIIEPGEKIGALFVDASKGWGGNKNLLRVLAPYFVPGPDTPTKILFQDFFYFPSYKLFFLLSANNSLKPIKFVSAGCSVVLEVTGNILNEAVMQEAFAPRSFGKDGIYQVWDQVLSSFPREKLNGSSMGLALPLMLWNCGHRDAASMEFERLSLPASAEGMVRRLMDVSKDKAIRSIPVNSLFR